MPMAVQEIENKTLRTELKCPEKETDLAKRPKRWRMRSGVHKIDREDWLIEGNGCSSSYCFFKKTAFVQNDRTYSTVIQIHVTMDNAPANLPNISAERERERRESTIEFQSPPFSTRTRKTHKGKVIVR